MAITASELAQQHADLDHGQLEHLQRLLGSWGILADLSFSDLLLMVPALPEVEPPPRPVPVRPQRPPVPVGPTAGPRMVVLGQMRPSNRPTVVEGDLVGQTVPEESWSSSARALETGTLVRDQVTHPETLETVNVESIPVRCGGRPIAVLVRLSLATAEPQSLYELTYMRTFRRLATMVSEAEFPFPGEDVGTEETPRVGDGFVVVDDQGRVEFASPNAINAFHRMGVFNDPEGKTFTELGVEESAVEWALATGRPVVEEVERRPDVIVLVHCIPLIASGAVTGSMILLRDVTDVRRLDRLLLSKDAAIREVHHRVKNNLQTISSLLSLQARRVGGGLAREALHEAERRVRSIAVVHEILSREPGDEVPFDEIVAALVTMAEDSVVSSRPVEISVTGDLGAVPAEVATPLAVTLAELLQNAVEHAFGDDGAPGASGACPPGDQGHVHVSLEDRGQELFVEVRDDGRGLPDGFDFASSTSLGLSIVRDLVVSQLEGDITVTAMPPEEGGGTRASIVVPSRHVAT